MEAQIFALNSSKWFAQKVCDYLQIKYSLHEERDFTDGEHKVRPLENVRGRDVFIIQSLHSDEGLSVNDKLCRLLFFVGALKDASAAHVTVVIPYLAYARTDRKIKDRDPITTKYMAQLIEASGVDQIISMDVHNIAAYQNSFRIPNEHLEARLLFAPYFENIIKSHEVIVVSPDPGGVKRAEQFRQTLEDIFEKDISSAFIETRRSHGRLEGHQTMGDVKDKVAIIYDDIINTGNTLKQAAEALAQAGALQIYGCITHGLFSPCADEILTHSKIDQLLITNTISAINGAARIDHPKVTVLDSSILFAKAIRRSQSGDSLVELSRSYPRTQLEQHWPN